MPKRAGGKARDQYERESDLVMIHEMRLRKMPPSKILKTLNELQVERAVRSAESHGMTPAEARSLADAAQVSPQTLRRDFLAIRRGLREGSKAGGELLVMHQIEELELERQTLILVERRAWEEFESAGEDVEEVIEHMEPVEIPPEQKGGEVRKVLRPKHVVRRKSKRQADPRWLEQVESCVVARLGILDRIFNLCALLAEPPKLPIDLGELSTRQDQAEQVLLREVEFLYRVEARASGKPVDQQRLKVLQMYLAGMREEPRRRGGERMPTEPGGDTLRSFEELDIRMIGSGTTAGSDGEETR